MNDSPPPTSNPPSSGHTPKKTPSVQDEENAVRSLSAELCDESIELTGVVERMRKLRAKVRQEIVHSTWPRLSDIRRGRFRESLGGERLSDPHFRAFVFQTAAQLQSLDAKAAREILRTIARQVTKDGRKVPGPKDVESFAHAFISSGALAHLDLSGEVQATISPFLRLIIGSAFPEEVRGESVPVGMQRSIVNWLLRSNVWPKVPDVQKTHVAVALRAWPSAELDALRAEFPSLPFEIPKPRGDNPVAQAPVQSPAAVGVDAENAAPPTPLQPRKIDEPAPQVAKSFSALQAEMKRLWEQSEEDRAAQQRRVRTLESDCRRLQDEMRQAVIEGERWRVQFHELEEKATKLASELGQAKESLAAATREVQSLQSALEAARQLHATEIKRVLETAEIEKQRALEAFCNKLASGLRAEHSNFLSIVGHPMDVSMGEGLRELLARIFEALKRDGINL